MISITYFLWRQVSLEAAEAVRLKSEADLAEAVDSLAEATERIEALLAEVGTSKASLKEAHARLDQLQHQQEEDKEDEDEAKVNYCLPLTNHAQIMARTLTCLLLFFALR
jgi:chromosome segregation ATPase